MNPKGLFVVSGEGDDNALARQIAAELRDLRAAVETAKKNGNGGFYVSKGWAQIAIAVTIIMIGAAAGAVVQVLIIKDNYVTQQDLLTEANSIRNGVPNRGAEIRFEGLDGQIELHSRRIDRLESLHPPGN